MSTRRPSQTLRMAVKFALGRFRPSKVEEVFARVQASIQLERHRQAVRRMDSYMPLKVAKDKNPFLDLAKPV